MTSNLLYIILYAVVQNQIPFRNHVRACAPKGPLGRTISNGINFKGGHMRNKKGFALIELMVVVAVIGIFGAIVFPIIQRSIKRASATQQPTITVENAAENCEVYYQNSIKNFSSWGEYSIANSLVYQNCLARQNLQEKKLNKTQLEKPFDAAHDKPDK